MGTLSGLPCACDYGSRLGISGYCAPANRRGSTKVHAFEAPHRRAAQALAALAQRTLFPTTTPYCQTSTAPSPAVAAAPQATARAFTQDKAKSQLRRKVFRCFWVAKRRQRNMARRSGGGWIS
jgi:hypothetical protein